MFKPKFLPPVVPGGPSGDGRMKPNPDIPGSGLAVVGELPIPRPAAPPATASPPPVQSPRGKQVIRRTAPVPTLTTQALRASPKAAAWAEKIARPALARFRAHQKIQADVRALRRRRPPQNPPQDPPGNE